jgi:glycosyltransferase involved in cell wall biosynthesis
MLGTSPETPGGIAAVVRVYAAQGLFAAENITYIATHGAGSGWRRARLFGGACFGFALACARRPALVHMHMASRGSFWRKFVLSLIARLSGTPYLVHLHGGDFRKFYLEECNPVSRRLVRSLFDRAAHIAVLSDTWRHWIGGISANPNVSVVPNPVVVPRQAGLRSRPANDSQSILFMGLVRHEKGVYDLIRAMPRIIRERPAAHLHIAGNGELARARELTARLGLQDHVTVHGWIDAARRDELLLSAHVFVLPSYHEGMPMSVLEAMAWGVPVITTPVGGIPDLVVDRRNAILVTPGDVDGLAAALLEVLQGDPCEAMRRAAFETIDMTYDAELVMQSLSRIYRAMTEPKQPLPPPCRAENRSDLH